MARHEAPVLVRLVTPAIAYRSRVSVLVLLALLPMSAYARLVQQFTTSISVMRS